MAALQCDICGGKLMGRPGGIFECDSCGMQYDTAWAKEKIQEIKGTVKVEGTVQVTGTVQVDNSANLQNLLNRMQIALNDGLWQQAAGFAESALNVNAQCFEAYLGKLLCNFQVKNMGALAELAKDFEANLNYQNAIRFADSQYRQMLENCMYAAKAKFIQENAQEEAQALATEQALQEARAKRIPLLAARRAETAPAKQLLRFLYNDPFVLTAKGQIRRLTKGIMTHQFAEAMQDWNNIQKFEFVHKSVLILDRFGNVYCMVYEEKEVTYTIKEIVFKQNHLVTDHTAVDICADHNAIYVLTEDGTLQVAKVLDSNKWDTLLWNEENIVRFQGVRSIVSNKEGVFCECMDGTRKKVSLTGTKDLSECDDCTLYNRDLRWDGTVNTAHSHVHADKNWDQVIDLLNIHQGSYGLMLDGTVVKYSERPQKSSKEIWQNIAAIVGGGASGMDLYGITNDGRILVLEKQDKLLTIDPLFENLGSLKATMSPYNSVQERKSAWEAFEKETRINAQREKLIAIQTALQEELPTLKGIFAGKRRKEVEARLAQIETELKELN